jgi:glycine betaine/proline transport system ATP-binding protein
VAGQVHPEDNLEKVIAISGGETGLRYAVIDDEGRQVGVLEMDELVRALVPTGASEGGMRTRASA